MTPLPFAHIWRTLHPNAPRGLVLPMSELWRRLRVFLRSECFDYDLEEEMQAHLAMQAEGGNHFGLPAARRSPKSSMTDEGEQVLLRRPEEQREIDQLNDCRSIGISWRDSIISLQPGVEDGVKATAGDVELSYRGNTSDLQHFLPNGRQHLHITTCGASVFSLCSQTFSFGPQSALPWKEKR